MIQNYTQQDLDRYMTRAVQLAMNTYCYMSKPRIGAIIVRSGEIIAEGYKRPVGNGTYYVHAERDAINKTEGNLEGCILVTTLEPCVKKERKQLLKSCSDLIIETGIEAVVIGLIDNSETVNNGKGISYLTKNGVKIRRSRKPVKEAVEELMTKEFIENCKELQ